MRNAKTKEEKTMETKKQITVKILGKCGHDRILRDPANKGTEYWQEILQDEVCGKCQDSVNELQAMMDDADDYYFRDGGW